jgi:hypothetical protein
MPLPSAPVGAYSPNEIWFWNGMPLSTSYYNVATFGGSRFGLPTNRGQDYAVPYRAGQLWRAKYPDERTITLTMWTDSQMSANQSYPAGDPRRAFNDNWQALRAAFFTRGAQGSTQGQLQRNWYLTSGGPGMVTSTAMAEIAGSMDPTMNGRTSAAFSVDLLLSDPYFYGAQRSQVVNTSGSTITAPGEGVVGEGFASAVNAFTVTISQASTVTNNTAGVSVTHNGAGVASWPVTIDVLRYTAVDNVGNNVVGGLSHIGSRMWMCLVSGSNHISVSAGTALFTWSDAYV